MNRPITLLVLALLVINFGLNVAGLKCYVCGKKAKYEENCYHDRNLMSCDDTSSNLEAQLEELELNLDGNDHDHEEQSGSGHEDGSTSSEQLKSGGNFIGMIDAGSLNDTSEPPDTEQQNGQPLETFNYEIMETFESIHHNNFVCIKAKGTMKQIPIVVMGCHFGKNEEKHCEEFREEAVVQDTVIERCSSCKNDSCVPLLENSGNHFCTSWKGIFFSAIATLVLTYFSS